MVYKMPIGGKMFQQFYDAGAEGYDRLFGRVPKHFASTLLRAAQVKSGHRVLDIATGTGLVAEGAARIIGPSGLLTAADVSRAMLAQAEQRLDQFSNVTIEVADGQSLPYPDSEFDVVLCSLALMLFSDPARGLVEFRRVLRDSGRVAVSVETTAERSLTTRINTAIGRHIPSRAAAAATYYSLGHPHALRSLFETAGYREIEVFRETARFSFPSFDAYFDPIEHGAGSVGAEFIALPASVRRAVREDVWRGLGAAAAGSPIEVEVAIDFAVGSK
jgi:ubiquinone/menaquinone biosynthesis C-methylase UbiE